MWIKRVWVGIVMMAALALAACSGSDKPSGEQPEGTQPSSPPSVEQLPSTPATPPKPPEPVELSMYNISGVFSDEEFQQFFFAPLQQKYPHISVKMLPRKATNADLDEMVATNSLADIVVGSNGDANTAVDRIAAQMDIAPLIKQFNFDMNQIAPSYRSLTTAISGGGSAVHALPLYAGGAPIYYNKDIFDKFGVAYPQGTLTWDELFALTQRLARRDRDVQYYGFLPDPVVLIHMNQRSLPMLDSSGLKPAFNTSEWASYLSQFKRFFALDGYQFNGINDIAGGRVLARFNADVTLAMFLSSNLRAPSSLANVPNWDLTPLPTFADKPGIGLMPYAYFGFITKTSKHPEQAFQALAYFASDEFQLQMSRQARYKPISGTTAVKTAFASDPTSFYAGKNVAAIFADEPAPLATSMFMKHHNAARGPLFNSFREYLLGMKDINTALRESAEAADKAIATAEAAEK